jgi:hypothetical protein
MTDGDAMMQLLELLVCKDLPPRVKAVFERWIWRAPRAETLGEKAARDSSL